MVEAQRLMPPGPSIESRRLGADLHGGPHPLHGPVDGALRAAGRALQVRAGAACVEPVEGTAARPLAFTERPAAPAVPAAGREPARACLDEPLPGLIPAR